MIEVHIKNKNYQMSDPEEANLIDLSADILLDVSESDENTGVHEISGV